MIRIGLRHLYGNLEQYFCAFLMVLMVFCLGAQVFFRFVLNASLTWSEELSRFAFIWLVYMGAVLGAKERIHIRVTAFHRLLPAAARGWGLPAADLLWVAINLTFAWQGALQVGRLMRFSSRLNLVRRKPNEAAISFQAHPGIPDRVVDAIG